MLNLSNIFTVLFFHQTYLTIKMCDAKLKKNFLDHPSIHFSLASIGKNLFDLKYF